MKSEMLAYLKERLAGIKIQLVGLVNLASILMDKVWTRRDGLVGSDLSTTREDNVDRAFRPRSLLEILSLDITLGRRLKVKD